MPRKAPKLSDIPTRQLYKKYRQLDAEIIRAGHNWLRQGQPGPDPTGGLQDEQRGVRRELERRAETGDPEMEGIIAQRLRAHMRRSKIAEQCSKRQTTHQWFRSGPDVLRRRQLVLRNPKVPHKTLCKLFDNQRIPIPDRWEQGYKVSTWLGAYENDKLRQKIHKIISTDRRAGES